MRRSTLFIAALLLGVSGIKAQTVATFESLSLATADTYYVNYSYSGADVGFNSGLAHFPCVYDTSWGGFWSYGFAYSNMTDSVTSGFMNQYSAKTAGGYGGSSKYVVAYGITNRVKLIGAGVGHPVSGMYVTNSTYAYNSMRSGDMFARKFHNGDWFKLTAQGYHEGALQPATVSIYLANFLFPDTTMNYILKNWQWMNLTALGPVDSIDFTLSSTDNGSFGMNTPAYFCIDNFTTNESTTLGLESTQPLAARVYPNPATNTLYVDFADKTVRDVTVLDMAGHTITGISNPGEHLEISTAALPAGMYVLHMQGDAGEATMKFVKQ